jgi:large subunit ribosomal protein L3
MAVDGLLGKKLGMTQVFDSRGQVSGVTVLEVGPCYVTQVKTSDSKDGYAAVQLGFGEVAEVKGRTLRLNKPAQGHIRKSSKNTPLLRHLREFRTDSSSEHTVGDKLDVSLFNEGDLIDVIGISKGKGFAGVVKRHHFSGGPKTHGQSDRHRRPGSIGSGTTPGRVLQNLRMAGRMGNDRVTQRNLRIIRVDADRNLLLVRGSVPGASDGLIMVRKAIAPHRRKG